MERSKRHLDSYSSSSSSSSSLDHLFGPKGPSSPSSSSAGLFDTIFPPPSTVLAKNQDFAAQTENARYRSPDDTIGRSKAGSREHRFTTYQHETIEPSYLSSSIYYGGQENYSPRTRSCQNQPRAFKKDGEDRDDPNGGPSNSAARGNWWQGSLYY